jgi:hypothetical protein
MRDDDRDDVAQAAAGGDEAAPPSETELMRRDARARKLRALGVLGAVVVLGGVAAGVAMVSAERERNTKLAEAYGALGRCLWGEVLAEGQTPASRVRAAQLVTMALPENERADWPMRCAAHAFALKERLADAGRAEGDGKVLAATAAELAATVKEPRSVYAPLASIVDRLVDEAARAKIVAAAPPDRVPDPPAGPAPLTLDALAKAKPLSTKPVALASVVAESVTDSELRLVLRDSDRGPLLCTIGAAASCRALPASMKDAAPKLRFAGTVEPGAEPVLLGDRDGRGGVFRSDSGDRIDMAPVFGAHARKDGAVVLVGFDDKGEKIHVARRGPAIKAVDDRVDPAGNTGNGYFNLAMLWEHVVWKAVRDDAIHVFARKASFEGELVGAAADLGQITEPSMVENKEDEEPHVTGCRTKEATVARVKGWSSQFLTFFTNGQWSFPVRVPDRGGLLTCFGQQATLTFISERIAAGGGRVVQRRCDASGCKTAVAKGEDLVGRVRELAPADAVQTAAADLDGKLLFLWIAGEGGGLRMKLAPVDAVARAPSVVVFDPLMDKGKLVPASTLHDMRLYVRGGVATVLVDTAQGVYAVRIGADGAFAPIDVAR